MNNLPTEDSAQSQVVQGDTAGLTNANLMWSQPTGTHVAPAQTRPVAMMLVGALVVLGALGAAAVGFFVARADQPAQPVAQKAQPAATAKSGKLVVYANPRGATLTVNGRVLASNVGPEGVEVPVESGELLDVAIERPGYRAAQQRLKLAAGTTQHLNINLQPLPAGTTAASAVVSSSTVKSSGVKKKKADRPRKRSKARSRRASKRAAKAEKKSTVVATAGTLSLSFTPANAKVYLDNNVRHGGSPLQLGGVTPGKHTVAIQAPGYATLTRTVSVRAGEEIVLSLALQKAVANQARLDIVTSPAGAMISINGKERGTSPLIALMLPPNKRYRFSASMAGYTSNSVQVTASAGRNRPVVLTLKKSTARAQALKVALNSKGNAKRGVALFSSRCGSCHGKKVKKLSSKSRTAAQWSRFLASGRHAYRQPLRGKISVSELKDIKAYLMSDAADTERAVAAGVR